MKEFKHQILKGVNVITTRYGYIHWSEVDSKYSNACQVPLGKSVVLDRLVVKSSLRGLGRGSLLISNFLKLMKSRGYSHCCLIAHPLEDSGAPKKDYEVEFSEDQRRLHRFYRRNGFRLLHWSTTGYMRKCLK